MSNKGWFQWRIIMIENLVLWSKNLEKSKIFATSVTFTSVNILCTGLAQFAVQAEPVFRSCPANIFRIV